MGNCSPNRLENYQNISQYFDVYNVDARLLKQKKGRIQITQYAMILYQKNEMPIIWPLSAIRKFGSHKDIFLFESGRRCLTGEGMFAFKCKQSKSIEDCLKKITNSSKTLCNLRSSDNDSSSSCNNTNNNIDQSLAFDNLNPNKTIENINNSTESNQITSSTLNDSNKINSRKTKNILNVTAESINSTRKPTEPDLPSTNTNNEPKESNIVPYYVNFDAVSKIGSPINLSVTNLNCSLKRARTDYVNSEEINPALLNLAKKINGDSIINSSKSTDEEEIFENKQNYQTWSASSFNNKSSIRSKNKNCKKILDVLQSASTSSKLNYIIPERILNSKNNSNSNDNNNNNNSTINNLTDDKITVTSNANGKLNDLEEENEDQFITQIQSKEHIRDPINEVEYLVIDFKKTPAIKSSTMLLNQRRKEYLTLNIK